MNFLRRGLTSIVRRPGKTLILLLLVFVLSNVIAGAVSVKGALAGTKQALINSIGAVVKVQIYITDDFYDDGNYDYYPAITQNLVDKIAASEYVKSYDYSLSYYLQAKGIKNYTVESEDNGPIIGIPGYNTEDGTFEYRGGQSTTIGEFSSGNLTLKEGRVYTEQEIEEGARVVLISSEVAEKNNLALGSKIKCVFSQGGIIWKYDIAIEDGKIGIGDVKEDVEFTEYEFEVIGIFNAKPIKVVDTIGQISEEENPYINTFFTTNKAINDVVEQMTAEYEEAGRYFWVSTGNSSATFTLTSPEVIEIFEIQNAPHLDKGLIFVNNSSSFKSLTSPMTNVEWIADIIMWVAVVASIVIIGLLVTLFLRDRRHEMGIYLALGERKGFIAMQILTEVLAIAVIAVSLSIFSGNIIAREMSSAMLENQLKAQELTQIEGLSGFNSNVQYQQKFAIDSPVLSTDEVMNLYEVKLDGNNIAFIYAIAMGSMLVSTLIPIVYTLQLKPKKILM